MLLLNVNQGKLLSIYFALSMYKPFSPNKVIFSLKKYMCMYAPMHVNICTSTWRCTLALVHMWLKTRRQSLCDILRNAIYLHWGNLSLLSISKSINEDCCLGSLRDPARSASRAQGLRAHTSIPGKHGFLEP